jgi:hypothetical protein
LRGRAMPMPNAALPFRNCLLVIFIFIRCLLSLV